MGAALRVSLNSCFLEEFLCNRVRSSSFTDSIVTDQLRLFDKVIVRQGLRRWRKLNRKFWIAELGIWIIFSKFSGFQHRVVQVPLHLIHNEGTCEKEA